MHGVRVLLPVVLIALVVAAVSSVVSARPDLRQAQRKVDASWNTLAPQLDQRYTTRLDNAATLTAKVAGPVKTVAADVTAGIGRWKTVYQHGSVNAQVNAANDLEALGRRLVATASASPRVAADPAAKQALAAYVADPTLATAGTFNETVAQYERERSGPLRHVVASLLGDGDISAFDTTVLN
jgi:hypothetical protein